MQIIHVTEPVEFAPCSDGVQFTLRSGTETFSFHMDRQDARAASAEVWRMLDASERESANVHALRKRRR